MWIVQIEETWRNISRFKKRSLFCVWLLLLCALSFVLLKNVFLKVNRAQAELDFLKKEIISVKAGPLVFHSKQGQFPNFGAFVECCSRSDISLVSLKPGTKKSEFLPIQLVLEGHYRPILSCLENFNQGDFNIKNFDMKIAEDGLVEINADLAAYPHIGQGQKNLELSAIKDPFQSRKAKKPMNSYDLSQMRLLGIIRENTKYYAIVADPSNKIYSLAEGSFLGVGQARVLSIKDQELEIKTQDGGNVVLKLRENK